MNTISGFTDEEEYQLTYGHEEEITNELGTKICQIQVFCDLSLW